MLAAFAVTKLSWRSNVTLTQPLADFAAALGDGGAVDWQTTPPRVRVASRWARALQNQPERVRAELREVLRRAAAFRNQIASSAGGPLPLLTLPAAPAPRCGACISCGVPITSGWRCAVCLIAVYLALDAMTTLTEIATHTANNPTEAAS